MAKERPVILAEPLLGAWCVDGCADRHAGGLAIEDGRLQLKLFIEGATAHNNEWHHPTLEAVRHKQTTCIGFTSRAGKVTLLRCVQSDFNASLKPADGSALVELTLVPTQAWSGSALVDPTANYIDLSFTAVGLHNILANAHLESEIFLDAETTLNNTLRQQLRAATKADDAYLVYKSRNPKTKINYRGKEFEIEFSTSISNSGSSYTGINIHSRDTIHIAASSATIDEYLAVKNEIEQFLSILCVGKFVGQSTTVQRSTSDMGVELLWQLGHNDEDAQTVERLPHQVLTTLGQRPELTEAAVARWFEASEQRRIARGLVCDTLSETTFSNARFLALAQAWEIIGRELSSHLKHEKSLFTKACDEAADVLQRHLGPYTAGRLRGMLKSNNQPGFRKLVEECLKTAPQYAVSKLCDDATKFAKAVSDNRNLLTHFDFEEDEKDDLYRAFRASLYLTYKMTVLFCVLEAQWLRIPLDNLPTMLENNRLAIGAKRPIPE